MKTNHLYWKLFSLLGLLVSVLLYPSCSKMDEYKKYVEGGEIKYTGKIDSLKVYSGKNRVLVTGLFLGDPKIRECRIFWNSRSDSLVVPVNRVNSVDSLRVLINNLAENVYNFDLITYDDNGNRSIVVNGIGHSYGDLYQSSLMNRPIEEAATSDQGVTSIQWGSMDLTSGVFATELAYVNDAGEDVSVVVPIDSNSTILGEDYVAGSILKYRTKFLPDTMCIDTFYTDYQKINIRKYVTAQYLVNTSYPFSNSAYSGRWGIPDDWTVNDAVKNYLAGGVYYGGVDRDQGSRLSMEAGWNATNLLSFNDGKIYQSSVLPAGNYTFEVYVNSVSSAGSFYIAAALGGAIPDIADLATEALAYRSFTGAIGTISISFELTEEQQVSLGIVGSLVGTGSTGQYFKVETVKLQYLASQ